MCDFSLSLVRKNCTRVIGLAVMNVMNSPSRIKRKDWYFLKIWNI